MYKVKNSISAREKNYTFFAFSFRFLKLDSRRIRFCGKVIFFVAIELKI